MNNNVKEIAKIASEWWADAVIRPKQDIGDDGIAGLLAMVILQGTAKPVTDEVKQRFTEDLANRIEDSLHKYSHLSLDVDYSPCNMLFEAAKQANLSTSNFPVKTFMSISSNMVTVRLGYGAKEQCLYPSEKKEGR